MPQTWLVTGCSSGFGEIFVRQLRALGENVIATGRHAETKLTHLKDTGAAIMDLDVSAPASEIETKMAEAWSLYPDGIDVVVNNAGYILSGALEEITAQELEDVMKTNFHGPMNITRSVLPKLREKGKGTLLYMSSQAGWHADPSASGYCASKFALEGAVECLSEELSLFAPGLKVLIIEPGYFRTAAFSKLTHAPPRVAHYASFNEAVRGVEAGTVGNEPGDAEKGVAIMIDLVKGTGVAAGRDIPLRVPLGSDGWGRIRAKCEKMIKICDDWEEVAKSTDFVQQ
ncbi:hypothetical protein F5Y07DRAFT_387897 [Xylaria sp. FL0933]|nr:hypothetical protein F5Y07DRAFT_387897 [Xylaria sp. FL0933]